MNRIQDINWISFEVVKCHIFGKNDFYRVTVHEVTGFVTKDFDTMLEVIDFLYPKKEGQVG